LLRQRLYQIIAGYEDANDADRLRHDPAFQILADQPLGEPLGSQPTLSRWENSPSPRDLLKLQDALLDWFVKICGEQVRKRGEILLDVDSTDDPTYGQQQLSFFNGGYDQHMYHPLLVFERHTGYLLAARLRAGTVPGHARIIPLLLRIVPRLQREFPKARIKLRADAGFALPLLSLRSPAVRSARPRAARRSARFGSSSTARSNARNASFGFPSRRYTLASPIPLVEHVAGFGPNRHIGCLHFRYDLADLGFLGAASLNFRK
jgi:hypothetical protein